MHKECLKVRVKRDHNCSCECFEYGIQLAENEGLNLCAIYRLPNSNMGMYIQDFTTLIEESITGKHELITAGDFNIHMENRLNVDTILFDDILEAFNLINKVIFLTHIAKHNLDLIISQQDLSIIQSIERGELLSDYHFKALMETKKQLFKVIKCRSLKNIETVELSQDLAINTTQMMHNETTDVTALAQQNNDGMAEIMVKHTPIKTKKIKIKYHQPWFNDRLQSEIKLRRWKEKMWLHDPTEYNLQAFYNQRRFVANLAKSLGKKTYYHSLLPYNQHDYNVVK